jgi:hypothetical protein
MHGVPMAQMMNSGGTCAGSRLRSRGTKKSRYADFMRHRNNNVRYEYVDSLMEEFHVRWCGFVLGVEPSCFETIWPRQNLDVLEI